MKTKLTEKELTQQYQYRASCVADLIGKWHGPGNRKITQRVLKEPSRWTIWAMTLLRPLIPNNGKRHIRLTPLLPIAWVLSFSFVRWVRYIDRRRFTLKQAEDWCRAEATRYLETDGQWLLEKVTDARAVLKSDRRIAKDAEYNNLNNLTIRTQSTIATILLGTPLDEEYPRFTASTAKQPRWQKWLGLKSSDSPLRVLLKAFWKPFRAGLRGDFTLLRDINTHFTATGIAREQGYNKGRGKDAITAGIKAGVIQRAYNLQDEAGNVTEVMPDPDSGREYAQVETNLLVNHVFEIVTNRRDKVALQLQLEACQGYTLDEVLIRHTDECRELGFNTPDAIRKRVKRLPDKYPQLKTLKV